MCIPKELVKLKPKAYFNRALGLGAVFKVQAHHISLYKLTVDC